MKIRPYSAGDFDGIMAVWIATGLGRTERGDNEETIRNSISIGGCLLVMVDDSCGDRITGTSWLTFDGRRIHLHHFGIVPEYQGKGLSKLLLHESLCFVKEKGYQVKIEVERSNTVALALYLKAGFKYLGDYDVYIIRDVHSIDF